MQGRLLGSHQYAADMTWTLAGLEGVIRSSPATAMKRGRDEYETLRRRVFEALGRGGSIPPADGDSA
jgi:hypothetical protein